MCFGEDEIGEETCWERFGPEVENDISLTSCSRIPVLEFSECHFSPPLFFFLTYFTRKHSIHKKPKKTFPHPQNRISFRSQRYLTGKEMLRNTNPNMYVLTKDIDKGNSLGKYYFYGNILIETRSTKQSIPFQPFEQSVG